MNYVVGQYYRVRCFRFTYRQRNYWLPILHTHLGEFSGKIHHHVDLRFIDDRSMEELGIKLDCLCAQEVNSKTERRRKMCHRAQPNIFRFSEYERRVIPQLQDQLIGRRLDLKTLICPHQGCRLDNVEPTKIEGQTCLVCPCHAIAWSTSDGSLVRRKFD